MTYFKCFLFLLLIGLVGCDEHQKGLNKARILIHKKGDSTFEYKEVTYKTLSYNGSLQGDFGSYYTGTLLDENIIDLGDEAKIYYAVEGDTIIPTTMHSNILLTHYYYLETLLEFWKQRGLDFYDVKYRVYYEPRIVQKHLDQSFLMQIKGNAAFIADEPEGYKSFAMFAKDPDGDLPVGMNFTVWAHEFGHNMFDKAFAKRNPRAYQTTDKHSRYVLNGMNEGVADFFSSVVTKGNISGVHVSIPKGMKRRSLPADFTSSSLSNESSFYEWGTVLASSLYELGKIKGQENVALMLYKALEDLGNDWDYIGKEFNFHHLIKRILKQVNDRDKRLEFSNIFMKWFDDIDNKREMITFQFEDLLNGE